MITVVIGTDNDSESFENAQKYLVANGYKMVCQTNGHAGSQEVQSIKYRKGERELVLESETYVGVTLSAEADDLSRICNELAVWQE
jgi:hypothetical protein